MKEHIDAFKASVDYLVHELQDTRPDLWTMSADDIDDVKLLMEACIPFQTANNAVACAKYYKRGGMPGTAFMELFSELCFGRSFNRETVMAGIIWNWYMERVPQHIRHHKQMPVRKTDMLTDFVEQGDLDYNEVY